MSETRQPAWLYRHGAAELSATGSTSDFSKAIPATYLALKQLAKVFFFLNLIVSEPINIFHFHTQAFPHVSDNSSSRQVQHQQDLGPNSNSGILHGPRESFPSEIMGFVGIEGPVAVHTPELPFNTNRGQGCHTLPYSSYISSSANRMRPVIQPFQCSQC